jgi:hypothetical protein
MSNLFKRVRVEESSDDDQGKVPVNIDRHYCLSKYVNTNGEIRHLNEIIKVHEDELKELHAAVAKLKGKKRKYHKMLVRLHTKEYEEEKAPYVEPVILDLCTPPHTPEN